MIKAKDLRIGNWVIDHLGKNHKCVPLSIVGQSQFDITEQVGYIAIPLTEEILLKCGHEKIEDELFQCDRIRLKWLSAYDYWYVTDTFHGGYLTKVKYLHEYQNAFVVFMGKELEVKL